MLNAEMIIVLWFVPVLLAVVIPLSVLCIQECRTFLRKIGDYIEESTSVEEVRAKPQVSGVPA